MLQCFDGAVRQALVNNIVYPDSQGAALFRAYGVLLPVMMPQPPSSIAVIARSRSRSSFFPFFMRTFLCRRAK